MIGRGEMCGILISQKSNLLHGDNLGVRLDKGGDRGADLIPEGNRRDLNLFQGSEFGFNVEGGGWFNEASQKIGRRKKKNTDFLCEGLDIPE